VKDEHVSRWAGWGADCFRNEASEMTLEELEDAMQWCEIEMTLWEEALDKVRYYLEWKLMEEE